MAYSWYAFIADFIHNKTPCFAFKLIRKLHNSQIELSTVRLCRLGYRRTCKILNKLYSHGIHWTRFVILQDSSLARCVLAVLDVCGDLDHLDPVNDGFCEVCGDLKASDECVEWVVNFYLEVS